MSESVGVSCEGSFRDNASWWCQSQWLCPVRGASETMHHGDVSVGGCEVYVNDQICTIISIQQYKFVT